MILKSFSWVSVIPQQYNSQNVFFSLLWDWEIAPFLDNIQAQIKSSIMGICDLEMVQNYPSMQRGMSNNRFITAQILVAGVN